jgi:ferredoxin-NAD(P)+ reductase (naphthalene dioxygenase ferredoxin-specific)
MSVRLSKPFTFSPGQYTNVTFSNGETRPYSPIGEIEDGIIDYIIKIHRQGRVGRYLEKQVEVGDQVIVSGPFGSCFLKENLDAPIIFIASDTGLAPVLAMMQGALAKPDNDHPIVLIFSVASNRDLFLFEWLKDFANKNDRLTFIPLVTSGPLQSGCERGLITDLINDRFEDLQNWHAYIAGTVTMVEWVSQFVVRKGIHPNHLYSEAFYAVND